MSSSFTGLWRSREDLEMGAWGSVQSKTLREDLTFSLWRSRGQLFTREQEGTLYTQLGVCGLQSRTRRAMPQVRARGRHHTG